MVKSCPITEWSVIRMPFEYRTKFCLVFRPPFELDRYSNGGLNTELPFEYRTSECRTSESLLFRCSLFRSPLQLDILKQNNFLVTTAAYLQVLSLTYQFLNWARFRMKAWNFKTLDISSFHITHTFKLFDLSCGVPPPPHAIERQIYSLRLPCVSIWPPNKIRYSTLSTTVVPNHCSGDHDCSSKNGNSRLKVGLFFSIRELFFNFIGRCSPNSKKLGNTVVQR